MKELLIALINSNNESGKHIHYLYRKYCKLIYGVDYGYKIYNSEELFTDFMKYILDIEEFMVTDDYINIKSNPQVGSFDLRFNDILIIQLRNILVLKGYEKRKYSNLNTLKNAKLH